MGPSNRVGNVVRDPNKPLTQQRYYKMNRLRANILLIPTTSNYFWASEGFQIKVEDLPIYKLALH